MPKSRVRSKQPYTPPPTRSPKKASSPPWLAPVMVACFIIGIAWLAAYYITNGDMAVLSALGNWNLLVGFGFILVGFGLATQWR